MSPVIIWDEDKRKANLIKHGIDFVDAEELFDGLTVTAEDTRIAYGERRFVVLGVLHGKIVSMAYTERFDDLRIISIRKAMKHEERYYFSQVAK